LALFYLLTSFYAAHDRHVDIKDDTVIVMLLRHIEGHQSIFGLFYLEVVLLEKHRDNVQLEHIIVGHQNS